VQWVRVAGERFSVATVASSEEVGLDDARVGRCADPQVQNSLLFPSHVGRENYGVHFAYVLQCVQYEAEVWRCHRAILHC
jgi:hypothetical protein